jgi:Kef-type K+ transport system membrane component KefB
MRAAGSKSEPGRTLVGPRRPVRYGGPWRAAAARTGRTVDATTVFIVVLFLLVAGAVLAGEVASRLGQAALVGQLAVGVVLGPTLLGPVIGLPSVSAEFGGLQILATFFVLMTAGLAITPEQIYATGPSAALLGVTIFLAPFLGGSFVVHYLYPSLPWSTEWFVSLTVSVTALPVLGVMLSEFNLLKSRFGTYLLNGSLVNELGAVTTFSVLLRIRSGAYSPWLDGAIAVLSVAVFLSAILATHFGLRSLRQLRLWSRMVEGVRDTWRSREAGFALLMVGGLAAALFSQWIGLTFLVGAFYAGLLVTPESAGLREHRALTRVFDAVTWGFFIPLFFALVGLNMDLSVLATSAPVLLAFVALCVFAFLAKVAVGGAVTRALGWSGSDALGAGFLVASRGAVELAMAVILLSLGIFDRTTFTIVAGVGLVTTFLSPVGARPFVRRVGGAGREPADAGLRPWIDSVLPIAPGADAGPPPLP